MADEIREYSNGEITIVWRPSLCIHSTCCYVDLPEVFAPAGNRSYRRNHRTRSINNA